MGGERWNIRIQEKQHRMLSIRIQENYTQHSSHKASHLLTAELKKIEKIKKEKEKLHTMLNICGQYNYTPQNIHNKIQLLTDKVKNKMHRK